MKNILAILLLCLLCETVQAKSLQRPPLILIHGAMGATLVDNHGEEVWPGGLHKLVSSDYPELELVIDPDSLLPRQTALKATALIESVAGQDYYASLLKMLAAEGYIAAKPGISIRANRPHYYVFIYDGRQDLVILAQQLHEFLDQVRADHGSPDLRFDVIAHSVAGSIVSYFLRFGSVDILGNETFNVTGEGARYLRRIVYLGAPLRGSVKLISYLQNGAHIFLGRVQPETNATYPSMFQQLPHPQSEWAVDHRGEPIQEDLYDVETWQKLELAIFDPDAVARIRARHSNPEAADRDINVRQRFFAKHLLRGKRFMVASNLPMAESITEHFIVGGNCLQTTSKLVINKINQSYNVRFQPPGPIRLRGVDYEKLMLAPGDGNMTVQSLLPFKFVRAPEGHGYKTSLHCEEHSKLASSRAVQSTIATILKTGSNRTPQ